ncbi:MAG TPA: amidase [Solirubrobacterales bacterium]|jgi:amidase|nr:amidase [Solirubrobacterales bacterium]
MGGQAIRVDEDVVFAGAARQAEMVRSGEVSPTELVRLCLDRIGRLDPELNSFRIVLAERALLEAEQAEARVRGGDERPLLGVPIALKDEVDLAGETTTRGTDAFPDRIGNDSEMVRRLREAGAIVVGKTLLPELAICGFTESATWGVTRNPWDPQRTPGGSSGGSAAAVAAGLVPIASASDGAGSIRIPAASCGLFGLKPQRGRISLEPRLEHWNGLSVNGCVSRNVLDTALWLDVAAGDSPEPGAPPPPERPFIEAARTPPGRLRIAHSTLAPRAVAPPAVSADARRAVSDTAELLRSLGHVAEPRDPNWGQIGNHTVPRYLRGIAEDVDGVPLPERLERRTRAMARLGRLVPAGVFESARRAEQADAARVNAIFEDFDLLMTPVMGGTALPVRRWEGRGGLSTLLGMSRFYPYCLPWNHLGNPAMSVPAGFAADGMPLAVQVIARPGEEATLLSLAAQLETERPWADRRPPIS